MRILEYRDIFLTRSGIGLKRFQLISDTIHLYKGKRNHFWMYALFQFIFKRRIKLKGNYFVVHNHWCPGYFHWITEALPRLLEIRPLLTDHILVLPESFKEIVFDSIEPLYKGKVFWIPQNKNLLLQRVLIPENPPYSGVYNRETFYQLREVYRLACADKGILCQTGGKIYVSRSKATRRKVVNERDVIDFLRGRGFDIVNFEDYSFWQQVAMMQQTEILISIHGAGLSNVLFMKEGTNLIEMQKELTKSGEKADLLYKDFSQLLGVTYRVLTCHSVDPKQSIYEADIVVNLQHLNDLLHLYESQG